ncbi:MAG: hypothetical protein LBG80_10990 [Bacteroidales bacterium]|jgi:hypothetical protein|nr:hypothetical protein [Bacteroidales bacterium]
MANKFRPVKNISKTAEEPLNVNKHRNRLRTAKTKKSKGGNTRKKIRKAFDNIFGLGILKKVNFRKNLPYFVMIVAMIITLIYNSLNTQSKKLRIERLEDEIIKINDILMDIIEEEYNIDDKQEKELLIIAKEDGFQSSGYIPYTIKVEKNKKDK